LAAARQAVAATGYDEISLLSLSTSDYPRLDELIERLNAEFAPRHVSISLPSLRVDSQLRLLPALTSTVRKGGLTIAAEAGSERLRRAIRKGITETDMLAGVREAYRAGWRKVKVYFMAGLPGETPDDIDEIFRLCLRLSDARREVDGQRGAIGASVSWFVPKPHTPMQWCPMRDAEYFFSVRSRLRELSRRSPVTFRFHWIERSVLEGVIARGDRRLADAIEAA
ncbi:MAG TPA: B12-binding domain-containing radical SAM protein, partial [Phycisphaerales bacterium]|nr:B12-binding domain-containing radical SAM protein [Phycisphaerales bacterium]